MTSSLNQRVVVIDLDDITDKSDRECEDDFSGVVTSTQENPSPNLSPTLGHFLEQSLEAFDIDLNKSATDLEIDLIEEIIDEDIQIDSNININQIVGNNYVKDIESYLKSRSDGKHNKSPSKRNKSKKSKKRLIKRLFEENLNLYRMVTELKKQLDLKTNENKELLDLKSRNLCLKCRCVAMNSLQELFCSIGNCCRLSPKSNSNDLNQIQAICRCSDP